MICVAVALTPCFYTTCYGCWLGLLPFCDVSVNRNEFWMNELVLDLRNGHVWQTRVKLSISSLRRYSSVISILRGLGGRFDETPLFAP